MTAITFHSRANSMLVELANARANEAKRLAEVEAKRLAHRQNHWANRINVCDAVYAEAMKNFDFAVAQRAALIVGKIEKLVYGADAVQPATTDNGKTNRARSGTHYQIIDRDGKRFTGSTKLECMNAWRVGHGEKPSKGINANYWTASTGLTIDMLA